MSRVEAPTAEQAPENSRLAGVAGAKVGTRWPAMIFVLTAAGMVVGGIASYRWQVAEVRNAAYQGIAAIAELKVQELVRWRGERLEDARQLARERHFSDQVARWMRGGVGLGEVERAQLVGILDRERAALGCVEVALLDPAGRVLLTSAPVVTPLSAEEAAELRLVIERGEALLGELHRAGRGQIQIAALAPLADASGRPFAVVQERYAATDYLFPLIQRWPTASLSAETLLVRRDGDDVLYLNELRHRQHTALLIRHPAASPELPAAQAIRGVRGMVEGRDYRGIPVIADLRQVAGSSWFMIAKVDTDEVLSELRFRAGITVGFVVLSILLAGAVTGGFHQRRRVHERARARRRSGRWRRARRRCSRPTRIS